jgi:hypothetical protein
MRIRIGFPVKAKLRGTGAVRAAEKNSLIKKDKDIMLGQYGQPIVCLESRRNAIINLLKSE